ncbi:MAG: ABC transporter permease [Planctomycetota bacterium]
MALPLGYNLRNLFVRRTATAMTVLGVACVVLVFLFVMGLAEGFRAAVAGNGLPDNALVLRDGAQSEVQSAVDRGAVELLRTLPQVAAAPDGAPICCADMVVVITHPRQTDGEETNVTVRGVTGRWRDVRPFLRLEEGAWFTPGSDEVVVGRALVGRMTDCRVGGVIRTAGRSWRVVGVFSADGSAFESELWGDGDVMIESFRRKVFQSMTLRLRAPGDVDAVAAAFAADPRLKTLQVRREDVFYAEKSEEATLFLRILGAVVTAVMAVGAVLGAMNTMYASVAYRTREIGTLRAIGFRPASIFIAFLLESLLLCSLGAGCGVLLASPVNGLAAGTMNWTTFSEIAFQFRVTPALVGNGILFGLVMGVLGGAFPAWRAARLPVVRSLRRA